MNQTKILFFVERNLHLPYLEPVHDYFQTNYPEINLAFSAPPYRSSTTDLPGCGLDESTIQRLAGKSKFIKDPAGFGPDATLVSDINAAIYLRGCGRIINVGHGMISKGCFYTHRPIIRRENLADLICVPGPIHKKKLRKNVFIPIETTGFIKSDKLFGLNALNRSQFCQEYNIDPKKNIILFAPTYNPELSAIPVVQEKIFELTGNDNHLIIKLHGMTDVNWANYYKTETKNNPFCTFIEDQDLTPCLTASDLLISDVSSAFVEFMLLDKPIVLVENPLRKNFIHYDPEDIEYDARKACVVVKDFQSLKNSIHKELKNPDRLSELRRKCSRELCYGQDGYSVKRTTQAVIDNLKTAYPVKFSVVVIWDHMPEKKELLLFWENFSASTKGFDLEVIMAGPKPELPSLTRLSSRWIECKHPDAEVFNIAVNKAEHEHIALIKPNTALPPGWLKFLYNHFKWNDNVFIVQAMHPENGYKAVMDKFFDEKKHLPYSEKSFMLNRFLIGSSILNKKIDSPCMMFSKKNYTTMNLVATKNISIDSYLQKLSEVQSKSGINPLMALDVFAYPYQTIKDSPRYLRRNSIYAKPKMSTSLIIPVHNNLKLTRQCVDSILKHTDLKHSEIIIIDNGSTDGSSSYLTSLHTQGQIKLIKNLTNKGFAKACNQGAKAAQNELLLFLNNDTIVTEDWLHNLNTCLKRHPKCAAVSPKLLYPDNTVQHAGVVFTRKKTIWHIYKGLHSNHPAVNKERSFQAITAACMLTYQHLFFEVGMFDERFINGFEDIDLCLKYAQAGYSCFYCPKSVVYHLESKTPGRFERTKDNENLLFRLWSNKVSCDEHLYYNEDLINTDYHTCKSGEKSFIMYDHNDNHYWNTAKKLCTNTEYNEAEMMFHKALQFNPFDVRNFQIMDDLAELYIKMNKIMLAEKCLSDLVKVAPSVEREQKLSVIRKNKER
ncbi:glycosyltransferase [Desulfonatronovibrio magnus]|uniref:glycosyltransferase n=1 Tax=Desulfonatronovibrio magnus TaxID=698827 RepID=UPI0018DB828F|nr:glycosyltransferase [Desulfonatronovibrio magnus]